MPVGTHSGIYTPWLGVQHIEHDLVTSPGQGPGNKGTGSQSGLLFHMQRGEEATGFDKFCKYGTTTGKLTLMPLIILAWGELQDSSQSLQETEARPRGCSDPIWWCTFRPQTKSISRPLIEAVVTTDASKEGYGATWTTCPSGAGGLQKGAKTPHQYPGTGNSVDGLSKVQGIIEVGRLSLFR